MNVSETQQLIELFADLGLTNRPPNKKAVIDNAVVVANKTIISKLSGDLDENQLNQLSAVIENLGENAPQFCIIEGAIFVEGVENSFIHQHAISFNTRGVNGGSQAVFETGDKTSDAIVKEQWDS